MQQSQPVQLSSLEAGILMALQALVYAATKTPGFNIDALKQAAAYFKDHTGGVPPEEKAAFQIPLNQLISDVSNVHAEIEKHPFRR